MPNLVLLRLRLHPLQNYVETIVTLLNALPCLKEVYLPAFPDISPILSSFSGSLMLCELCFSYRSLTKAVVNTGNAPVNFPALERLKFSVGHYQRLHSFLGTNRFSKLTSLMLYSITIEQPVSIKNILNDISQCCPCLENLDLGYEESAFNEPSDIQNSPGSFIITLNDLIPILDCKKISYFSLDYPYPISLSDTDIEKIALEWSNLKALRLPNTPWISDQWSIIQPTLQGILLLAQHCPNLEELAILIETKSQDTTLDNFSSPITVQKAATLTNLDVGDSLIEPDDVSAAVELLSRICSSDCALKWNEKEDGSDVHGSALY
ncbi:hypothetical protein VKT23_016305 [Stygiomarasmius scandens]|uniref:F-box protein n=1 Tax=Marasmiellus scandens TaxID=2682957 RepID=A0ABR1IXR0_9AGAR